MSDSPRVVSYCRQSEQRPGEDRRTSLSIRSQQEHGRAWAASIGGTVVAEIVDHDLRGADTERPGIKELIETVRAQRVDAVWLFSISRLARDLILQLMVCRDLERAGVGQIFSELEGGIDDPFIRGIHGLMAEQYTRQTSAHLKAAFARRARDGGFPTGPAPFGYRRPHTVTIHRANGTSYQRATGEPVIDPTAAALVLSLFTRFDEGASLHQLANELADQGSGPRGGRWSRTTLRAMLSQTIYAGDISHKGDVVAHNDKWQIVPRDLFDRVQTKLHRLTVVRRDQWDSWLEGLVYHECGDRMYWQAYTGHSRGAGGMFVCRGVGVARAHRCTLGRRIFGGKLLESVVMRCLIIDFTDLRTPTEAAKIAQERSGGISAVKLRAQIEKRLHDAQARWQRNHERFSLGRLPGSVMDAEDALLAQAEIDHAEAIRTIPEPQSAETIAAVSAQLVSVRDLIETASPARLRELLSDLGTVLVTSAGVRVVYLPQMEMHLPSTLIPVPRGGKGLR